MVNHSRRAFSLIELAVVVAVVGILVGLLLPAVQAIRESARVVQCQNHLKQIGLAIQSYSSAHRRFPGYAGESPSVLTRFDAPAAPDPTQAGGNWIAQSLAFMEQPDLASELSRLVEFPRRPLSSIQKKTIQSPLATLNCPTRRDASSYPILPPFDALYGTWGARNDYAMCGGSAEEATIGGTLGARSVDVTEAGFWQLGRGTRDADVLDGLSHTYAVGEKSMDPNLYVTGDCQGDLVPIGGDPRDRGTMSSFIRYAVRSPQLDRKNDCRVCHEFGSAHATGWNAVWADGSVRMLTYSLTREIHQASASIRGHEVID